MVKEPYCQSCGRTLGFTGKMNGTDADGKKNPDYCGYCYNKGEFTFKGTLDEMIHSKLIMMEAFNPEMTEEEAKSILKQRLSELKRWKH
jgi:hypothetical protein